MGYTKMTMPLGSDVRVLLYERRRLVREGLAAFLDGEGADVDVCSELSEFGERLRTGPDAVVVGVDGADDVLWTVLERHARMLQRVRSIGVLTTYDVMTTRRARKLGITRIVLCEAGLEGVREALRGEPVSAVVREPTVVRPRAANGVAPRLTDRELAVVRHISLGLTASQIADELGITGKTVENHKQRIYRKLDVQSQSQAVGVALRRGLLQPVRPVGVPATIG